jgi:hypothetical protein
MLAGLTWVGSIEGTHPMTAKTRQDQTVVAVFKNRHEADQAKQAIQASGLNESQVFIDDHVSPSIQVAAQGTTVGGEAGFLLGGFFGGVLGLIATIIAAYWFTGHYPASAASRWVVVVSAITGALLGSLVGKGLRASQPADQKIKGNPNLPRQFRLMVAGGRDQIRQAQQALGQPPEVS